MGFTTPCFIRKNTQELRKKLEELGYKPSRLIFDNEKLCLSTCLNKYTHITNEMFDSKDPHTTWNCAGIIDCGTNEELFLAIAALRDDSNYMQWFICTEDYIESPDKEWKVGDWDLNTCLDVTYGQQLPHWRKATVDELIEHFKGKEEQ